jgi:hypothetical protein
MHCHRWSAVILPMTAALTVLLVSCGESKVSQCQKIIKVTNQAVTEAKSVTNAGQNKNPDAILKTADTMDQAAQDMKAIQVSDTKLKDYQAGFIKMYGDTSKATRALVGALKKKDRTGAEASLKNLQQATVPEQQLVTGLNSYCQSK